MYQTMFEFVSSQNRFSLIKMFTVFSSIAMNTELAISISRIGTGDLQLGLTVDFVILRLGNTDGQDRLCRDT